MVDNFDPKETHVLVSRTPKVCGANAAADAIRVTRSRIIFIIFKACFV